MITDEMKKKLSHIAHLTNSNNHGGARWHVADLFPYLALYKRRFDAIDELHKLDGSMNFNLLVYRNNTTHNMLKEISNHESKDLLLAVTQAL